MKDDPHEILTNEQMAEADRLAVEMGVPSLTLMENAGRAVADEAEKMVDAPARANPNLIQSNSRSRPRPGASAAPAEARAERGSAASAKIIILCGPGNNGGDGFVAARYLNERGYDVSVYLYGAIEKLKGDAAEMAKRWLAMGDVEELLSAVPHFKNCSLVIDAIFGAGLTRALSDEVAKVVATCNKFPTFEILSVDVPSGLNGTTGEALGGKAVRADRTVTFFRLKPGHLLFPGRELCGKVIVAEIGIPPTVLDTDALQGLSINNPERLWLREFPTPRLDTHKYTRGHALAVSGPAQSTGAIRLAARAALRVGAGLVTVASPKAAVPVNAAHLTAVMIQPFEVPRGLGPVLADKRRNAVVLGPGCGVGSSTREMVQLALHSGASCVLDADALTAFSQTVVDLTKSVKLMQNRAVVLTPHEGEFARLFPDLIGSKLERAGAAARRTGAIVVLKGPDTVIASPHGKAAINANAPPWLATAGSGDVLAGLITGLLAQRMPAFEAACAAVWIHGECANRFGPGLIAEDLPEIVPQVLQDLYALKKAVHDEHRAALRKIHQKRED